MPHGEQCWDPQIYQRNAAFNVELSGRVLELLAPRPGERVLDLGAGEGALTEKLVAAGCQVVAIDKSEAMVAAARARGLDARVLDAQRLDFESDFDAVFSNAALHWMLDPDAVIRGVYRALCPGGRFVAEFGGHGVLAGIRVALHAALVRRGVDGAQAEPWYFPTAEAYAEKLATAGFDVAHVELVPRPTLLTTGLEGWLDTFAGPLLSRLGPHERQAARDEVLALTRPVLCDERGRFWADYVRLRVVARRPGSA